MKNEKLFLFAGAAALWLALFASTAAAGQKTPDAGLKIKAFESGLQALSEKFSDPNAPPPALHTLAARMAFYKVPGVSLAVISDGRLEWVKGYGEIEAGSGKAVTPETMFEAASTTKALVAAVVLHFVDQGRLDLDADVNAYLKSWKVPDVEFTITEKVTLRRLLTHQAGLPSTNMGFDEKAGAPTLLQVVKGDAPAENKAAVPVLEPGRRWQYSNIGFVLVQLILEDVLDRPLESILAEVIYAPCGLTSTTLVYPLPPKARDREALPHDGEGKAAAPAMHPTAQAQGGLMTTPTDLARFLIELMEAYGGASTRLFSRETARTMFRPAAELNPHIFGTPMSDALGVFVKGEGPGLTILHPGNNYPGSVCWMIGYPDRRQGAIVMLNGNSGEALALEILAALSRLYDWPALR